MGRCWALAGLAAWGALAQEPVSGRYVRVEIPKEKATLSPAVAPSVAMPDELRRLRDIYEKSVSGFLADRQSQGRANSDKYVATLKALQERAQKAGNLDGVLAATEELARMAKGETVAEGANDAKYADLIVARTAYLAALRGADGDTSRRVAELTQKYGNALTGLQAEFTRKGQIDDALAVRRERDALDSRADVAWAYGALTNAMSAALSAAATAAAPKAAQPATDGPYLVIDLSGGKEAAHYPVSYLSDIPKDGWADDCKTSKLVLRRIKAGTFAMGSPKDELGRDAASKYFPWTAETLHAVTLTRDFYIGVFEVTQRQWELVMGDRPSLFSNGDCWERRPVEKGANFKAIRGRGIDFDAAWPESRRVENGTFLQRLRDRTGLTTLDLPTEAQWEYACRAGAGTALNSGRNLKEAERDPAMDAVGRYAFNSGVADKTCEPLCDTSKGTAVVGSYAPNAWGLYDMHGNVSEWCLDRPEPYAGDAKDPQGAVAKQLPAGGDYIRRGGSYRDGAALCRSAARYWNYFVNQYGAVGFRLALTVR